MVEIPNEHRLTDYIKAKARNDKILLSCHLDLTYKCNFKCVHCYICKKKRTELKTEEIKSLIDQLTAMNTLYLAFSGGEVFTKKDFFKICAYARKLHFALDILTNGSLIDEAVVDKLAHINPNYVSMTIFSTDPEINDRITQTPGSLKKIIKAAEMIRKRNLKLKIKTIIMQQNVNEYKKVYEFAKSLNANFSADPQITIKTNGDPYPCQFQITEDELCKVLSDPLMEIRFSDDWANPLAINTNAPEDTLCGAGHSSCYISPYGDVFPCVQFPLLCGNVREKSLEEIWLHSPEMLKVRTLKFSDLPQCSQCELKTHCRFCPGLAYLEEGDLLKPPKRNCTEAAIIKKIREGYDG